MFNMQACFDVWKFTEKTFIGKLSNGKMIELFNTSIDYVQGIVDELRCWYFLKSPLDDVILRQEVFH